MICFSTGFVSFWCGSVYFVNIVIDLDVSLFDNSLTQGQYFYCNGIILKTLTEFFKYLSTCACINLKYGSKDNLIDHKFIEEVYWNKCELSQLNYVLFAWLTTTYLLKLLVYIFINMTEQGCILVSNKNNKTFKMAEVKELIKEELRKIDTVSWLGKVHRAYIKRK